MECTSGKRINSWFKSEAGKLVNEVNSSNGESTVTVRHKNIGQSKVAQRSELCFSFLWQSSQQDFPVCLKNAADTDPGSPVNNRARETKRIIEVIWRDRIYY